MNILRKVCLLFVLTCAWAEGIAQRAGDCIAPQISTTACTAVCQGSSVVLKAQDGYASYVWSNGEQGQLVVITTGSGKYHCTATHANGCVAQSESIKVSILEAPPKPYIVQKEQRLLATPAFAYKWYYNGAILQGANAQEIEATTVGTYLVQCINEHGCVASSESTTIESVTLSTPESSANDAKLRLYPNPTGGLFTVQLVSEYKGTIQITIADLQGKEVASTSWVPNKIFDTTIIDLTTAVDGVYMFMAHDGTDVVTQTIVKQK